MNKKDDYANSLAVIGLSCCFPGAKNPHEFWQNLVNGIESITHFTKEELLTAGLTQALLDNPHYVRARGVIPDADHFDAEFFGFSSQEAKILDPQIRLFLEHTRNALEDAGYVSEETGGRMGIFAGQSQIQSYLNEYLLPNHSLRKLLGDYYIYLHNSNDFLATTVSYKLNLTGPSYTFQTACSTSLVAVVEACQHLLDYQCDVAIAGGVALQFPLISGYLYQEGMILSPDGHCRAFDKQAKGTVPGNGVGVVILKRYLEAVKANDHIYAIVKGFATNNDGNKKVGYSAPSVQGQAAVIEEALAMANCEPQSIAYIETHGTGTPQGDPIEIEALKQAFSRDTTTQKTCALGSVKTNIGHCDVASGIAGFIKTVLALYYQKIPSTLHFQTLNPHLQLEGSPFFINHSLLTWPSQASPRRAGVSAFGIGGTNAHVILEAAAASHPPKENYKEKPALFLCSAKDETALKQMKENLMQYLLTIPEEQLSDAAYTTQIGRDFFKHRSFFVAKNHKEISAELNQMRQVSLDVYVAEETTSQTVNDTMSTQLHTMPLEKLGTLWAKGEKIDWEIFNQNKTYQRLSLPTYPYQRKRYIAEPPITAPHFETYYYEPDWQWKPLGSINKEEKAEKKTILLFHDAAKQSEWLTPSLEKRGHTVIHIYQQDSFQKMSEHSYGINGNHLADYSQLIAAIWQEIKIDAVIFCLPLENKISNAQQIPNNFLAAFVLLKALIQRNTSKKITFSFLSCHAWKVYAQDRVDPFKSMLMGISKTIFYEAPHIITRSIDVDSIELATVDDTAYDLLFPSHEHIAYRKNQRFSLTYKQILLSHEYHETTLLKENGTYVFTGGLGGVSVEIAENFANVKPINLVLIHRSNFPDKSEWAVWLKTHAQDDPISQKIRRLNAIQTKGSCILLLKADVTNEIEMRDAFSVIKENFTAITGVIHTAGSTDGKLFSLQTPENLTEVMAAKIVGTLILYDILKTEKIDFLVLCSALTAITGSIGQLGYCSANVFMDSFAQALNHRPIRIVSINWDQWKKVGMALNVSRIAEKLQDATLLNATGLDKTQHMTALWQALSHAFPQLIVSNEPLAERIKKYQKIAEKYVNAHPQSAVKHHTSVSTQTELLIEVLNAFRLYLGNEEISAETDFFESGGDSLLAVQLVHTLERNCQLKISPHDIQLYPTPTALSQYLAKQLSHPTSTALVPLQLGSPQRILFLVHPVGGTFYVYRHLIQSLPKTLTIYGIQANDLTTSGSTSILSVEQIAANYVSIIKNIQPKAPYYLGGFSFGGVVAYEMARQLSAENHKVNKVIMIDSPHQKTLPRAFKDNADIIAYLLHLGSNYQIDPEEIRKLSEDEQIKLFLRHADKLERELPNVEKNVLQRFFTMFKTNSEAMANYHPTPYSGKSDILFFKALEKDSINPPHPEEGWKELLENKITVYDVSGNHLTMMDEPNVAQITAILSPHFSDIH